MLTLCVAILVSLFWAPLTEAQQFNRHAPLAQGLVSWWRVIPGISGGRQWYDLTGGVPATLTNMTTAGTSGWGSTTRPGGQGELRLDGTDDYALSPSTSRLWPAEATHTLWVYRTATGGAFQTLFGAADSTSRQLAVRDTGALYTSISYRDVTTGIPGVYGNDSTGPTIGVGVWVHLALQVSLNGGMYLYVNCQVNEHYAPNNNTFEPLTQAMYVGINGSSLSAQYLTARIDDLRVYARALSQAEICQVMRESSAGEPRLLPPTLMSALLAPLVGSGSPGSFLPFFPSPQ